MLSILSYVSGPPLGPPWRSVWSGPLPIFLKIWLFAFLDCSHIVFFIYYGDQTFVWGTIGKYIFPYSWFPSHFDVPLAVQKLFILMNSSMFILSFMLLVLEDISVKISPHGISEIFLPVSSYTTFMLSLLILKSFIHSFFFMLCSRGHIGENTAAWNIWYFPTYVLL